MLPEQARDHEPSVPRGEESGHNIDHLLSLRDRLEEAAPEVHRFVAQRVPNFADAEDIAQQTMLVACAKLSSFRNGNLQGWLFAIARHLIVDHYRAQRRVQFVEMADVAMVETEAALHTPREFVPDTCDHRARLQCYLSCISRRLSLTEEVTLLLADIYGYRGKDSAALMHLSLPSFKLLLHKSRVRLQEAAGGYCALVRQGSAAACAACADREIACQAEGDGRLPSHGSGLDTPALLALRDRLRRGLE